MNKVFFIGRIATDLKINYFPDGKAFMRFNLATDDSFIKADSSKVEVTDFHTIFVTGKVAETINTHFKKGMGIQITGKLKHRKYTDSNGVVKTPAEVELIEFEFLPREGKGSSDHSAMPEPDSSFSRSQIPE